LSLQENESFVVPSNIILENIFLTSHIYKHLFCKWPYTKCDKKISFVISYVFSSTKLENKRVEQVLSGSGGVEGKMAGGGRWPK
jgi:hypothetical protein